MNKIEAEIKLFNLYSALFCQPEKELFDNLKVLEEVEKLQCSLNDESCVDCHGLRKACLKYSPQELLVDYTKIFLGPFTTIAYPYSSVYFPNGVKTLFNETTQWVQEFYQSCGYEIGSSVKDMPDHIAVELEFLYMLKFNQLKYLNEDNNEKALNIEKKYLEFIEKHFAIWIPQFCEKVIESGENQYYINLCTWLKRFVSNHLVMKLT